MKRPCVVTSIAAPLTFWLADYVWQRCRYRVCSTTIGTSSAASSRHRLPAAQPMARSVPSIVTRPTESAGAVGESSENASELAGAVWGVIGLLNGGDIVGHNAVQVENDMAQPENYPATLCSSLSRIPRGGAGARRARAAETPTGSAPRLQWHERRPRPSLCNAPQRRRAAKLLRAVSVPGSQSHEFGMARRTKARSDTRRRKRWASLGSHSWRLLSSRR